MECEQFKDGKCKAGNIEVHPSMCSACLAVSHGKPSAGNLNRHLGSVVFQGYEQGAHRDRDLARRGSLYILRGMCDDAGLDFKMFIRHNDIEKIAPLPPETGRCVHLGKMLKRSACGCYAKQLHQCDQTGLEIIPEKNCPCDFFEEA